MVLVPASTKRRYGMSNIQFWTRILCDRSVGRCVVVVYESVSFATVLVVNAVHPPKVAQSTRVVIGQCPCRQILAIKKLSILTSHLLFNIDFTLLVTFFGPGKVDVSQCDDCCLVSVVVLFNLQQSLLQTFCFSSY